jgi:hypothetical protein
MQKKTGMALRGLIAAFSMAVCSAILADAGLVPDNGLMALKEDVYVLNGASTMGSNTRQPGNFVYAYPLETEGKPTQKRPTVYFKERASETMAPGMYRITTRGNIFSFMGVGAPVIIKADRIV